MVRGQIDHRRRPPGVFHGVAAHAPQHVAEVAVAGPGRRPGIALAQESIDLRPEIAGLRLDVVQQQLVVVGEVVAFVEVDDEPARRRDLGKQVAVVVVEDAGDALDHRLGAADVDAPEARDVAAGEIVDHVRRMIRLVGETAAGEQPVADAGRVEIAEQRDVVARHVVALGVLHEEVGAIRQMRPDVVRHRRQHEAEEQELADQVGEEERHDRHGRVRAELLEP